MDTWAGGKNFNKRGHRRPMRGGSFKTVIGSTPARLLTFLLALALPACGDKEPEVGQATPHINDSGDACYSEGSARVGTPLLAPWRMGHKATVTSGYYCDSKCFDWDTNKRLFTAGCGYVHGMGDTQADPPASVWDRYGLDIDVHDSTDPAGAVIPIYIAAPLAGTVHKLENSYQSKCPTDPSCTTWGNYVLIKISQNLYVRLAHLESVTSWIKEKAWVHAGTVVGVMGQTGYSISVPGGDPRHLHFQFEDANGHSLAFTDGFWVANPSPDKPTSTTLNEGDVKTSTLAIPGSLDGSTQDTFGDKVYWLVIVSQSFLDKYNALATKACPLGRPVDNNSGTRAAHTITTAAGDIWVQDFENPNHKSYPCFNGSTDGRSMLVHNDKTTTTMDDKGVSRTCKAGTYMLWKGFYAAYKCLANQDGQAMQGPEFLGPPCGEESGSCFIDGKTVSCQYFRHGYTWFDPANPTSGIHIHRYHEPKTWPSLSQCGGDITLVKNPPGPGGSGACTHKCALGQSRCLGNTHQPCAINPVTKCRTWGKPTTCSRCLQGVCRPVGSTCKDTCLSSTRRCVGNILQKCLINRATGCMAWGGTVSCSKCREGTCKPLGSACQDICTPGVKRCVGYLQQKCVMNLSTGCYAYGAWANCTRCLQGVCRPVGSSCQDLCKLGTRRCVGTLQQTCLLNPSSGCTAWGGTKSCTHCREDGVCRLPSATCVDVCQDGVNRCVGNTFQRCQLNRSSGCLAWGSTTACSRCQDQTCRPIGSTCTDACGGGKTRCVGNIFQRCTMVRGTGCYAWGTVKVCGGACDSTGCK